MAVRPTRPPASAGWVVRHPARHRDLVRRGVVISGFTSDLGSTRQVRALPGGITMVLALDGRVRISRSGSRTGGTPRLESCAAEMRLGALDVEPDARSEGVVVTTPPWVALGSGLWDHDATVPDCSPVLGPGGDELVDALRRAGGWDERFGVVDQALRLGDDAEVEQSWPIELRRAWELLSRSAGTTSISQVAADVGRSVRYLQQGFDDGLGLSPKSVARVFRLKRASRLLASGCSIDDVASTCGYCDQPHLTRDFKAVMGVTPRRYLTSQDPGALDLL